MRPIAIWLAAILLIGAAAPATVIAQSKAADKKVAAELAKTRAQGMAEAPAIAKAVGISCAVTDARFIGKTEDKKAKSSTTYYEIDCDQGVGFILQNVSNAPKPNAFTCVEANTPQPDGKPSSLPCKLPGNANPGADLVPLLSKAGVVCQPEATRGIGQGAKNTYLEVACQGGAGYVLTASAPVDINQPVEANNCLLYDQANGNIKCTLKDAASRLAIIDTYAAQANNGCTVKDRRYVGLSQAGSTYFETACTDGKGFLYKVDKGQLSQTFECAKASSIMGGCELTDAREAETAQAGLYTRLSKGVGFDCAVNKYAPFPSPAGKDVVEMSCSNRPDGAVGIFANPNSASVVVDCARAPILGYRCSFTKPEASYSVLTADLKKMGKDSCTVSNSRVIGRTPKGTTYMEVACSDGLKGYILEYTAQPLAPVGTIGCAFTKDCKLPGNV